MSHRRVSLFKMKDEENKFIAIFKKLTIEDPYSLDSL
jgi:hypothetical protein